MSYKSVGVSLRFILVHFGKYFSPANNASSATRKTAACPIPFNKKNVFIFGISCIVKENSFPSTLECNATPGKECV